MIYILLSCHKIIQNKAYNLKILCDFFFGLMKSEKIGWRGGPCHSPGPPVRAYITIGIVKDELINIT